MEIFNAVTDSSWGLFINFGIISIALLLATFIRDKIYFFQKFLIPNAITAGIFLLPFYNYIFPHIDLKSVDLEKITYHFLSLSFIAITLRYSEKSNKKKTNSIFLTATNVLLQMVTQVVVGLLLTLIMIKTFLPQLYHSFGFLLPLGYAQGPGQAYSIGSNWELSAAKEFGTNSLQFETISGAGDIGLTFAAVGFLICCFGGIILINYGIKKGWISKEELINFNDSASKTGTIKNKDEQPIGSKLTTTPEAIDTMTFHIALVAATYILSYFLLKLFTMLLSLIGSSGVELANSLWGVNYIFAVLTALLVKKLLKFFKYDSLVDDKSMVRISGFTVDIMVAAAIASISIYAVYKFWVPFLIIATIGGVITYFSTLWFCSRTFNDNKFLRTILIFGVSTGTLSTGLALLRVLDPKFDSPVAKEYSLSATIVFALVIPIILIIPMPLKTFFTGDMKYWYIAFGVSLFYLIALTIYSLIASRKNLKKDILKIFYIEK